jgi:hypothetical protein
MPRPCLLILKAALLLFLANSRAIATSTKNETTTNPSDATSLHDASSGFGRLTDLLATRNIHTYEMLESCGVNLKDPGPLIQALQTGDEAALESGADRCTNDEARQFVEACDAVEQCAGFDFLEFAQGNAHALSKSFFGCMHAFATQKETDIVVEQCMALVFNTGLWRPITYFLEYNAKICPCLPELLKKLPDCIFQEDAAATPLDGAVVKLSTCLLGEICEKLGELCYDEVGDLNECLPLLGENEINNLPCGTMEQACKDQGTLLFLSPPPLAGVSFPNRCQQIAAEGKDYRNAHVIERYNTYRRQCILKDDLINMRDFGSHDDPDEIQTGTHPPDTTEAPSGGVSMSSSEDESRRVFQFWYNLPFHTRFLAGVVAILTIAYIVVMVYACHRGKLRYHYSHMQMRTLGDGSGFHDHHEPYEDSFEDEVII